MLKSHKLCQPDGTNLDDLATKTEREREEKKKNNNIHLIKGWKTKYPHLIVSTVVSNHSEGIKMSLIYNYL